MVEVCDEIYGTDPTYSFYAAKAEETRIPNEKYDIVTAAGCINWVDERFHEIAMYFKMLWYFLDR
ncbi:hypothetical protein [Butyrivibrio sp. MC2013]|uniref:hypothetical protein n=1 Tax=Butyrivibrio sp. MC2013 TaxID=1280686 RepID=UPI0004119E5F|nr:hypothetical protein [Butyrivibrio sp. MC2013]